MEQNDDKYLNLALGNIWDQLEYLNSLEDKPKPPAGKQISIFELFSQLLDYVFKHLQGPEKILHKYNNM